MDVLFSPSGDAMYVVDLGAFAVPATVSPMPMPMEDTGVVWRMYKMASPHQDHEEPCRRCLD